MNKTLFFITLTLLCILGCERLPENVPLYELGCKVPEMSVTSSAGTVSFELVSNGDYSATIEEDNSWIKFANGSSSINGSGDGPLDLVYETNRGIERKAVISLSRGTRSLSLTVTQDGLLANSFKAEQKSVLEKATGGEGSAKVLTLFNPDELDFKVTYLETGMANWLSNVRLENNYLKFTVAPNYSDTQVRHADIVISHKTSGASVSVQVTQESQGEDFQGVDFATLKALLTSADTMTIKKHYVVSGISVGDNTAGNGGENRNISPIVQDLTRAAATVYLSNTSCTSGLKVEFDSADDNAAEQYDNLSLDLYGMLLTRKDDPVRYELSGASAGNVLTLGSGSPLSPKEKTMGSLTDEDIFTLVTLKNCEIPIRKGPYVPLDLRHYHMLSKYAMPIRDIEGRDMYMYVNTTCSFSRDGQMMPQGSGDITGVLVHETFDSYEWNSAKASQMKAKGYSLDYISSLGEIGRYQIRPQKKSDIALSENFKDGFSEMICEYRYFNDTTSRIVKNVKDKFIFPTYPAVEDPLTSDKVNGRMWVYATEGANGSIYGKRDWTHLGPLVNGVITDPTNGVGVFDYYGNSIHWYVYSLVASTGLIYQTNGCAWQYTGWNTSKYWRVEFSTKGIDASHTPMSVQFGSINGYGIKVGGPTNWAVEWSTNGGSTWERLANYTVPDFPLLASKRAWQCPGFKYFTFTFPSSADVWNKDQVIVRLIPTSDVAGTSDSYDGGKVLSSMDNALNYFAIRYNK